MILKDTAYENGEDTAKLYGNLTIGISKPITLKVDYGGIVVDAYEQIKAGFTVDGKISRKEFGLTWNAVVKQA